MKNKLLLTLSSSFITLSAFAQTNLLSNSGFESKLTGWTNLSNSSAVTGDSKTGTYSVRSGTNQGGVRQILKNKLVAGKKYRLTFWAKIGSNAVSSLVSIQVKNANGGLMVVENLPVLSMNYTQYTKEFTYPTGATSVEIATKKETGATSYLYVDDFLLTD